ncbi:MAG: site-specific DNA-methyltransferase [Oscillospiraceae bacterium]|nr:site-specific DNA-methyltransferase [Oscillospiraceae bacterium]
MDKLKMHTPNKANENFAKLAQLFPNAVTETIDADGNVACAIDKDALMQEISCIVVEGNEERYQFTWPDKKKSILLANAPIAKTLRPCREESIDFDATENLYIEGDNLDVLKLLQETYLGKIKVIFIDPPYNTGNDFVYNDSFVEGSDTYLANSGQFDEEGNRLVQNTESNGRFHTDWLNMIYPRLKLSKDLLSNDGVIFISIDDNEYDNLKKACDEVFGVQNRVGVLLWKKKTNGNNMGFLPPVHDYILCYAKDINAIVDMGYPITKEFLEKTFSNPDNDPRGPWTTTDLSANHKGPYFPITNPKNGDVHYPPKGRYWVFNESEVQKRIADGRIIFGKSGDGRPVQRVFATNRHFSKIRADSWWEGKGMNEDATKELADLFGHAKLFTHPKPSKLLSHILKICTDKNDYVLDFFSGSATTAHAVIQLNNEDGGNRKFIMVQLPEETDEKSDAYKAGYKNICEIGKERIRRAGAKIKKESPMTTSDLDTGFRVLKLDSTNMKDVYYSPADYEMSMFDTLADNIKEDRTPEDLLFQVMLDLGVLLSSKIEESAIGDKKVFNVADGFLMACFDENVSEETITAIAKQKPYYFVMRDSSMASDSVATNFDQIFATYSPDTVRKVL